MHHFKTKAQFVAVKPLTEERKTDTLDFLGPVMLGMSKIQVDMWITFLCGGKRFCLDRGMLEVQFGVTSSDTSSPVGGVWGHSSSVPLSLLTAAAWSELI